MPTDEEKKKQYVWYAGYGSNLCEEKFLCHIQGGKFKWGGSEAHGYRGKPPPKESKPFRIPHKLYFAGKSTCLGNEFLYRLYADLLKDT